MIVCVLDLADTCLFTFNTQYYFEHRTILDLFLHTHDERQLSRKAACRFLQPAQNAPRETNAPLEPPRAHNEPLDVPPAHPLLLTRSPFSQRFGDFELFLQVQDVVLGPYQRWPNVKALSMNFTFLHFYHRDDIID